MNRRRQFSAGSLSNVLLDTTTFARVGQGTYGLRAWGIETVDPYTDIIADVLKSAGKALTVGDILHRVNARRPINEASLQMYLWMHPRFYQSVDGLYGLRGWLPPREKQTLRTPSRLVEKPESYERVARAVARKYDVARIIAQDKS
jgi:hypothetical protein